MTPAWGSSENLAVAKVWKIAKAKFISLQHIYLENRQAGEAPFFMLGFVEDVSVPTIAVTASRDGARFKLKRYPLSIREIRSQFGKVFVHHNTDQVTEYRDFDSFIEVLGIEE